MANNQKPYHFLFHSFCFLPKANFDGQEREEEVILRVRAHPVTQIYWLINSVFFLLIIFLLNIFYGFFLKSNQIFFINLFFLAIIFSYFWFNFVHWFYNVGIVSNKRIIDMDFPYLLYKEVTMTMLKNIEDITAKSSGFLSSFFNYGDVFIQTAGTEVNIEFIKVPKASLVVKIINDLLKNLK